MERCGWCRGEGYIWADWDCSERVCPECDGEGYVDPYQEDEWYEDDDDTESIDTDQLLPPPYSAGEDDES